jgi:hypothetical protein
LKHDLLSEKIIPKKTENPVTLSTLSRPPAARSIVGIPLATPYRRSCRLTREGTVTAGDNAPMMHLENISFVYTYITVNYFVADTFNVMWTLSKVKTSTFLPKQNLNETKLLFFSILI